MRGALQCWQKEDPFPTRHEGGQNIICWLGPRSSQRAASWHIRDVFSRSPVSPELQHICTYHRHARGRDHIHSNGFKYQLYSPGFQMAISSLDLFPELQTCRVNSSLYISLGCLNNILNLAWPKVNLSFSFSNFFPLSVLSVSVNDMNIFPTAEVKNLEVITLDSYSLRSC